MSGPRLGERLACPTPIRIDPTAVDAGEVPRTVAETFRGIPVPWIKGGRPHGGERIASGEEREFIEAMHAYRAASGRMFPTWSEVLEVLHRLGYHKADEAAPAG